MEAEGVEESQQEQEADHTEDDNDQDGVHLHVHLLPWKQCCGGQAAEGRPSGVQAGQQSHCGYVRLYGSQAVHFRHDGRMCALCDLGIFCSNPK